MPLLSGAALLVSFLAWVSYVPVARSVRLRRTLWPTRAMQYLAIALACLAFAVPMGDAPMNLLLVGLTCLSFATFVLAYHLTLKLPVASGRPEAGKLLPAFELTGEDGKPFSSEQFVGKGPVLYLFFRGFWCLSCSDELRGIGEVRKALQAKGGELVAVCAQRLTHITDGREDHPNLACFLACDPKGEAIRKLAIVHAAFGKIGKTLAVPSNILVDATGMVRWAHYAEIVSDRPDPQAVLAQVAGL